MTQKREFGTKRVIIYQGKHPGVYQIVGRSPHPKSIILVRPILLEYSLMGRKKDKELYRQEWAKESEEEETAEVDDSEFSRVIELDI